MTEQYNDARVQPSGGEEESLREYGRQLAMDGLLELALKDHGAEVFSGEARLSPDPAQPWGRPWRTVALLVAALAASFVLGVAMWKSLPKAPPTDRDVTKNLAPLQQPSTSMAKQVPPVRLTPDEICALPPTEWGYQQAARSSPDDLVMLLEHQANVQLPLILDNDRKWPHEPNRF